MRHDLQNPTLVFCRFRPITVYNDADHGSHKLPHSTFASGLLKPLKAQSTGIHFLSSQNKQHCYFKHRHAITKHTGSLQPACFICLNELVIKAQMRSCSH